MLLQKVIFFFNTNPDNNVLFKNYFNRSSLNLHNYIHVEYIYELMPLVGRGK